MALPQRQESAATPAEIIEALATSRTLPESALRQAVVYAEAIAPAVLDVVKLAAAHTYLIPKQENLLLWGIHALAAARKTELCGPLLRLMRELTENELDRLLRDVTGETLPGVFLSVFDGDAASLMEACLDATVDGMARWTLLEVLARLTFDNRVPRQQTIDLLTRFEREQLARPGDPAWHGWQQAVILLGVEELRERMHATWEDGRNPQRKVDRDSDDLELSKARAMAPGDPALFLQLHLAAIDDPVAALAWLAPKQHGGTELSRAATGLCDPDPAELIALSADEVGWLAGFFDHARSPALLEISDGFFCGLIAGPGSVKPSEYVSKVWETDSKDDLTGPFFENDAQAEYVTSLLMRHWNTIAQRLDRRYFHSRMLDSSFDPSNAPLWALGFMAAIKLRHEEWQRRSGDDFVRMLLISLMALGGQDSNFSGKAWAKVRAEIADALPSMVQKTYDFWHGRRDPLARPFDFKLFDEKVPRNAACPCGSGKKFKRCCGSAK
jgi:uncharacterized protein